MLVIRPVGSYPSSHGDKVPDYIAAHADVWWIEHQTTKNIFGRLWDWSDVSLLFSLISKHPHDLVLIRGLVPDESSEWESLLRQAKAVGINVYEQMTLEGSSFLLSLRSQNLSRSKHLSLPKWGDYAFTLLDQHYSMQLTDTFLSPRMHLPHSLCDIIELSWNGAFEVHGVYLSDYIREIHFNNHSPNVWLNPNPIDITEDMIDGEGPGQYEMFRSNVSN